MDNCHSDINSLGTIRGGNSIPLRVVARNMDTLNENKRSLSRALGKRALVYIGILVLIFALVLILNTSNASAAGPTIVADGTHITANQTWNAAGSPYWVKGTVTVDPNVYLNITANTTVAFDTGAGLNVAGTLRVLSNGTLPKNVVTFTSNATTKAPGDWSGISFESRSVGSFSNVRVLYADMAIAVTNASVTFTGVTTITNTGDTAIYYTWLTGNHALTLTNFVITNALYGIDVEAAPGFNAGLTLSQSTLLGIIEDGVDVPASTSVSLNNVVISGGVTGLFVNSSSNLAVNVVNSSFLGQYYLGMEISAAANITLNVPGSTFDGQIAENGQLFYPSLGEDQYIIIQPEAGNWTTGQGMTADLPFDFFFNGVSYPELNMSLNGWLAFGSADVYEVYSGVYGSFDPSYPNLIAPAQESWSAEDYGAMGSYFHGMGYKYDAGLNAVIFQWFVWDANQPQLKNAFEVILYESGNVEFRYAMMDGIINYYYSIMSDYAFGINMYDGPSWNLYSTLGLSIFDMDYQSVSFSMETLSDGAAISAEAGKNIAATITDSSFSHYMSGGVRLSTDAGWVNIDVETSDFSFIYGIAGPFEGALVAGTSNGTMTATVSDCNFDMIGTAAIDLWDAPNAGGADSFVVESNTFNEVFYTASIGSEIDSFVGNVTISYVSEKSFVNNEGNHVGPVELWTEIDTVDQAWNVTETDVVKNNTMSGDVSIWLIGTVLPSPIQPMMLQGMISIGFVMDSSIGDNVISHTVTVTNNTMSDGSGWADVGAISVGESIYMDTNANLTKSTNVDVKNNTIMAENVPFWFAVDVAIDETMDDVLGNISSTVNANFVNNEISPSYYIYDECDGLGLYVYQTIENGRGNGTLTVNAVVTGNVINGTEDGFQMDASADAYNQFGDETSVVNVLVQDNEITVSDDAIEIGGHRGLQTSATFENYFTPYEMVATSNAIMTIDVLVTDNIVSAGDDSIYVYTEADATENYFGAFTHSVASVTGPVTVTNNTITVDGDYGIYLEIYSDAHWGSAQATSNIPVVIEDNNITALYDSSGGIYVYFEAYAHTDWNDYEWYYLPSDSMPTASTPANTMILRNTVAGEFEDGIYVEIASYAWYGISQATVDATLVAENNVITGATEEGIYFDMYSETWNSFEVYNGDPSATVTATSTMMMNTVSGDGFDGDTYGLDAELYVEGGDGAMVNGTIDIVNNSVSNCDYGVYAYSDSIGITPVLVSLNQVDNSGTGIEVDSTNVIVSWNVVTNAQYDGIYLDYCSGTVNNNNITGAVDNDADGIYVDYSSDLIVRDNVVSDVYDDGIYAEYSSQLTIQNNTISNVVYWGVDIYDAYAVFIENNSMIGVGGGVNLDLVTNGNVMNNVMSAGAEPGHGIQVVDECDMIVVMGNQITGFDTGVYVYGLYVESDYTDVTLAQNTVTMSINDGVDIYYCDVVVFADNVVTQSGGVGLYVVETDSLTMINGVFADNIMMGIVLEGTSADWNVNAASSVVRNDVLFSGDLTVMAGGSLKFDTVDVGIAPGSAITVMADGALSAIDTEFYTDYIGFGVPFGDYYEFNVFGTLEFINVYESDALELYLGAGSVVSIVTSTITDNMRNGIHIVDSAPLIMSSTIVSNPWNGIFIEGSAAAPKITDCNIANNDRGIYALNTKLEAVTDNMIVLNSEAGLFADNVSGSIHDNLFLFNHMEIYVRNSQVSIQDNQIGYSPLVQVMVQFMPLLQGFNLSTDLFLPELGVSISPALMQNIVIGHVGIYIINSEVTTSDNMLGMLGTAVQVVDSDLTFGDNVMQNTIVLPYMDPNAIIRNMSLPLPVWDGIVATNSHIVMNGGSIDVLDDAVYLDNSTATITSCSLKAMDFSLYLNRDSTAKVTDSTFGKVKVDDPSMLDVWEKLTVVVKDPWGTAVANVPVKVDALDKTTDSDGMTVVFVEAYIMTSSGKTPMNPPLVTANFTNVPTTGYPGHASWSPLVLSKTVSISGPTTVVLVPSMIVRFDLLAHAMKQDGKNAVNVTVKVFDASGRLVTQAQSNATGIAAFELVGYIQNADGTTDSSMNPYTLTAKIGSDTAQASTNLTSDMNLDVKVAGSAFNWGPAIIMGGVAAVFLIVAIYVLRRKP